MLCKQSKPRGQTDRTDATVTVFVCFTSVRSVVQLFFPVCYTRSCSTGAAVNSLIRNISILFLIPPTENQVITYMYCSQHQETQWKSLQQLCNVFVLQERTKGQWCSLVICSLVLLSICEQWQYTHPNGCPVILKRTRLWSVLIPATMTVHSLSIRGVKTEVELIN